MMVYVACVIGGFILALLLVNFDSIKSNRKKNKKRKRYDKLANGTPKHVVSLSSWRDLIRYRNYPIYIDGHVLHLPHGYFNHRFWEDGYIAFYNKEGNAVGYIARKVLRSYLDDAGRRQYVETLGMGTVPSAYGRTVIVSAVIEVY